MKKAILRKPNVFKIALSILIASVVLSLGGAAGCNIEDYSIRRSFKIVFDTNIYRGVKEIYSFEHNAAGDGFYYAVWSFPDVPEEILQRKGFYTSKYSTSEGEEKLQLQADIQKNFEITVKCCKYSVETIPQEYRPDWDKEFLYASGGMKYAYFPDTNRIIVWERY